MLVDVRIINIKLYKFSRLVDVQITESSRLYEDNDVKTWFACGQQSLTLVSKFKGVHHYMIASCDG